MQKYMRFLFELVEPGRIDPPEIITYRASLADVPAAYRIFRNKEDNAVKFVLKLGTPRVTERLIVGLGVKLAHQNLTGGCDI